MDMTLVQGIYTLILMIGFVILCVWAYLPRNKSSLEEQGNLPFADETQPALEDDAHE